MNIALIDNYLYLLNAGTGLRIFDISNPAELVEVNTVQKTRW